MTSSSPPLTSRTDSYCPAKEASKRSSCVLEDRTATGPGPNDTSAARMVSRTLSPRPSASASSTNPSGTEKPARARCPSRAAFPPARGMSSRSSSCRGFQRASTDMVLAGSSLIPTTEQVDAGAQHPRHQKNGWDQGVVVCESEHEYGGIEEKAECGHSAQESNPPRKCGGSEGQCFPYRHPRKLEPVCEPVVDPVPTGEQR